MVRLQSRGTTPSRPSPPDTDPNQSDLLYEMYGRHSPVKSLSSGGITMNDQSSFTGRSSNSGQPQRVGSFNIHSGSLSQGESVMSYALLIHMQCFHLYTDAKMSCIYITCA